MNREAYRVQLPETNRGPAGTSIPKGWMIVERADGHLWYVRDTANECPDVTQEYI